MEPVKLIFKVSDWDRYDLIYRKNFPRQIEPEPKWKKVESFENIDVPGGNSYSWQPRKFMIRNHQMWRKFCKNELLNFIVMTQEEFTLHYFIDILLEI